MNEYSPSRVRLYLETYQDYLRQGRVPPMRYDSAGWHVADRAELIHQKANGDPSDRMAASRIIADLQAAVCPDAPDIEYPWWPLTRGERIYILSRFFSGFSDVMAARAADVDEHRTSRVYNEATVKMAHNLGWKVTISVLVIT